MNPSNRPRGRRPFVAALARALVCLGLIGTGACRGPAPGEPFRNLFPTKEAAAQAVADALYARDAERLRALAVSEVEFRKNVWPALPASRPDVGMPVEYVWTDTSTKSLGYLRQTLEESGGRYRTVNQVTFGSEPTDYGPFRIHPETVLSVTEADGTTASVRLFGSMLETDDGWKVFSYVVD